MVAGARTLLEVNGIYQYLLEGVKLTAAIGLDLEAQWASAVRRAEIFKGEEGAIEDIFGSQAVHDNFQKVYQRCLLDRPQERVVPSGQLVEHARHFLEVRAARSLQARDLATQEEETTLALEEAAERTIHAMIAQGDLASMDSDAIHAAVQKVVRRQNSLEPSQTAALSQPVDEEESESEEISRPPSKPSLIRRERDSPSGDSSSGEGSSEGSSEESSSEDDEVSQRPAPVKATVAAEESSSEDDDEPAPQPSSSSRRA